VHFDINETILDYNDFYNINRDYEVRNYGNQAWISSAGPYTIRENPELLNFQDSVTYPIGVFGSYFTSATSNVRGSGLEGSSMGLMSDTTSTNYYDMEDDVFIDVNLQKLGITYTSPESNSVSYFNSVITQTETTVNSYYGLNKFTSAGDYYENQFGFYCTYDSGSGTGMFVPPFAQGDRFYNTDDKYVITNRRYLWPFDGISCPANPGRNYPTYPGYTTGLFGNPRANWANECGDLPCVIYDSIGDPRIIQDTISGSQSIQNSIKPPCEG